MFERSITSILDEVKSLRHGHANNGTKKEESKASDSAFSDELLQRMREFVQSGSYQPRSRPSTSTTVGTGSEKVSVVSVSRPTLPVPVSRPTLPVPMSRPTLPVPVETPSTSESVKRDVGLAPPVREVAGGGVPSGVSGVAGSESTRRVPERLESGSQVQQPQLEPPSRPQQSQLEPLQPQQPQQPQQQTQQQEDPYEKLAKLKKLLDDGVISQEEFDEAKKKLLGV